MKYVKQIEELLYKANRNGRAVKGEYVVEKFEQPIVGYRLIHYGTLILKYDTTNNQILSLGGYSESDANAINTALRVLGSSIEVSKAKKYQNKGLTVVNGWYIIAG